MICMNFRCADIGNNDGILPCMKRKWQGAQEDTIVLLPPHLMIDSTDTEGGDNIVVIWQL